MAVVDSERLFERLEQEFAADAGRPARATGSWWILAVASVGAGVVHFAYASSHFAEYWAYGAFFVGVAWLQLLWAYAIVRRPSRALLLLGALGNLAVIGVWALTRTAGDLIGPGAGSAEKVGFPDVLSSALEGVVVLGAVVLLAAPRLRAAGTRRSPWTAVIAGAALVGVAAGGAVAMTPKYAAEHAAHGAHAVAGTPVVGAGIGHPHNHDQLAEFQPDKPLDAATRATLAAQLTEARAVALQYPTVADAAGAGMILAGGFAPGSGAHYISFRGAARGINGDGSVDVAHPGSFIYDGTSPTSRIVGLMYISLATGPPPAGFAGPNDHWHRHANVCVIYGRGGIQVPYPADRDVTPAQCRAVGGQFMRQTVWMVHAWVVPGWESPLGVFSHDNPNVRCADGTYRTDSRGFCQGT
jgi:hypothetical protein